MPTAYDIAGVQYERPTKGTAVDQRSGRRYSKYACQLLQFFVRHRVALASQVHQAHPLLFSTDRDARRHLQTLIEAGDLNVLTYNDPRRPNVYIITDQGLDRFCDFLHVIPESLPANREDPKGDHLLHEILITQVAVDRYRFYRSQLDYKQLWEERFGFHTIPGFTTVIPDYADAYRSPRGCMIDFTEVLTGQRSITKVKEKLQRFAEWSETEEANDFLLTLYKHFRSTDPKPVFRLNIVAHNRNLVGADHGWERQVLNATFSVPANMQARVWTTTNAALRRAGGIDSPVWRSAATLVPHRSRWLNLPKKQRTKYLSKVLDKTPKVELFTFNPVLSVA